MEQINSIELTNENIFPTENVLKNSLGNSYTAYEELLCMFNNNNLNSEWRYYKDGKAWLCKVQRKKKTIIWMSVWKGYMKATIYFPERYLNDILTLKISQETKDAIRLSNRIGKSIPCMFEIKNEKVLKDIEVVMTHKINLK